jgi:hypothetical protein
MMLLHNRNPAKYLDAAVAVSREFEKLPLLLFFKKVPSQFFQIYNSG